MRACPRCGRTYDDDQQFCGKDGSTLTTLSGRQRRAFSDHVVEPGTLIGSYRVLTVLGKGGMGVVYEAENTRLGRKVALKVLRRELAADPMAVQRFFHEARAAHTVGHENIVEVFDFIDEGDVRAYVMERLDGRPLTQDLVAETPLPLSRTLNIARQVSDALAAVHEKGIIHRDLKPDNVFLTTRRYEADFVKLFDFGVAKLVEDSETSQGLKTEAGMILGTPAYMAPEQLNGGAIDRRVDIYAFGVMLYQMVTGRRPFRGRNLPELMMKHVSEAPLPPRQVVPELPRSVEALVLRCLEKDPARRPHDMHEIEVAVESIIAELGDGPVTAVALTPVELPPDDTERVPSVQSDVATLAPPRPAVRPALAPAGSGPAAAAAAAAAELVLPRPAGDNDGPTVDNQTVGAHTTTIFDETPAPATLSGLAAPKPATRAPVRPLAAALAVVVVAVLAGAAWLATRPDETVAPPVEASTRPEGAAPEPPEGAPPEPPLHAPPTTTTTTATTATTATATTATATTATATTATTATATTTTAAPATVEKPKPPPKRQPPRRVGGEKAADKKPRDTPIDPFAGGG